MNGAFRDGKHGGEGGEESRGVYRGAPKIKVILNLILTNLY